MKIKTLIKESFLDGYKVISYHSKDDDCFVAEIPLLLGCATDGKTREEALYNLKKEKEEWLFHMNKRGHPIPEGNF